MGIDMHINVLRLNFLLLYFILFTVGKMTILILNIGILAFLTIWSAALSKMIVNSQDGSVVYVAYGGSVYISRNNGRDWIPIVSAPKVTWRSIATTATGSFVAAATNTKAYISSNYGATWTLSFGSINHQFAAGNPSSSFALFSSIAMDSTGQYLAFVLSFSYYQPGFIAMYCYFSTNYCKTWENMQGTADVDSSYYKSLAMSISSNAKFGFFADYRYGIELSEYGSYDTLNYFDGAVYDSSMSTNGKQLSLVTGTNNVWICSNYWNLSYSTSVQFQAYPMNGYIGLQLKSIAASSDSQYLVAGDSITNSIFYSYTYGTTWKRLNKYNSTKPPISLSINNDGNQIIAMTIEKNGILGIYASYNSGYTWTADSVNSSISYLPFTCGKGFYYSEMNQTCVICQYGIGYYSINEPHTIALNCTNHMNQYINDGTSLYCNQPCDDYPQYVANHDYSECVSQYTYPAYGLTAPSCKEITQYDLQPIPGHCGYYLHGHFNYIMIFIVIIAVLYFISSYFIYISNKDQRQQLLFE
jgi:hypothetical protein